MLIFLTAVAVVLIVSFLCSIFESVLLSVTRPQVEVMIRDGRSAGTLLKQFKENMDVPIAAILILNTAAHTVGAAVAGASYSNVFSADTLWIFSIIFTLAVLLFTEIIPKTLGVSYAPSLASPVAHGIRWLTVILHPLVITSERMSRALRRSEEVPVTSPEEIRLLALLGRSEGAVGRDTAGMIIGATHLKHLTAHDVMLPREDVNYLSASMSRSEALAIVRETGHSRFPFSTSGTLDKVSGVVLAKEFLDWALEHNDETVAWDSLQRDTLIVPETSTLPRLMRTFQDSRRHLAVVIDEYGDVQGIVTMEDVLEEVVGDIRDEHDKPVTDIEENERGELLVRGSVDIRMLSNRLNVPWDPDAEVSTIGGMVTESLERIPEVGDTIEWQGHLVVVLRSDAKRPTLVSIKRALEDESSSS